jgi:radical SAM protein with 4Fe4S-binding SPASM domain
MLIKNCVLKYLRGDIWLYHTVSSYKVRMNTESVEVLNNMMRRRSSEDMTENERTIYSKLLLRGIAGPDNGYEQDRFIPVKRRSEMETLELEFSGRCNVHCAHCFAALSHKDMDEKTLDNVMQGVESLEPVNLVINGGEPLLNPLLSELLRRAREQNMRITLMTNGTLVDEATVGLLKTYGVAKVSVSLDFFEANHDAIRGAGSFGKAVEGIKRIAAERVPVFITAMVQDSTMHRLTDFENYCLNELGVSGIRFSSVIPVGRAKDGPSGLRLSAAKTKELFGKGVIKAIDENEDTLQQLAGSRGFHCAAGRAECFVSADGKVYACRFFQNVAEEMGDLSLQSLATIYEQYRKRNVITFNFEWDRLKRCTACIHFARCTGGCRVRARIMAGDWYEPDPYSCAMYGEETGWEKKEAGGELCKNQNIS